MVWRISIFPIEYGNRMDTIGGSGWNRTNGVYRVGASFTDSCHRQLDIPAHKVTQRVTRYFEVSILIFVAHLDGASVRNVIVRVLPAILKSSIGITNICCSLSKQNR